MRGVCYGREAIQSADQGINDIVYIDFCLWSRGLHIAPNNQSILHMAMIQGECDSKERREEIKMMWAPSFQMGSCFS